MTAEQLLYLGSTSCLKAGEREGQLTFTLYGAEGNPLLDISSEAAV